MQFYRLTENNRLSGDGKKLKLKAKQRANISPDKGHLWNLMDGKSLSGNQEAQTFTQIIMCNCYYNLSNI